jgi:hypothetical protein
LQALAEKNPVVVYPAFYKGSEEYRCIIRLQPLRNRFGLTGFSSGEIIQVDYFRV